MHVTASRRTALAALILAGLILAGLATGFLTIRGWADISIGTDTHYLSIYQLIHWHYQAGQ